MGLEPTTSASAGLRSIQTELQAHDMVPRVGVEPTCPFEHYALNVARLPFRHLGPTLMDPDGPQMGSSGFEPLTSCV